VSTPDPTAAPLSDEEKQIEQDIEHDPDFQAAIAADVKADETPAASPPSDESGTGDSPSEPAPDSPDEGDNTGDSSESGDVPSEPQPPADTSAAPPDVGDPNAGAMPVPPDIPGGPNNPTNPVEPTLPNASDADRDEFMQQAAQTISQMQVGALAVDLLIPDTASLAVVKMGDWRGLGWNLTAVETPVAVMQPAPNTAMPNPEQSVSVDQSAEHAGEVTADSPLTQNAEPAQPAENQ